MFDAPHELLNFEISDYEILDTAILNYDGSDYYITYNETTDPTRQRQN